MRDYKDLKRYGLGDRPASRTAMILWAIVGGFVWYGLIWLMMVAFTILQEMVNS